MAEVCDCNVSLSNTGQPGCVPIQNVISSLILVPLKDNDNNKNGLDLTQTFTQQDFIDLVNERDDSKRWYPLPAMEEVNTPKAESIMKEYSSGLTKKVRQGKRSFTGMIIDGASPEYLGKLKAAGCVNFGFYMVDIDGQLVGDYNAVDNYLYPIPASKGSWDPVLNLEDGVNNEPQHIMVMFDWDRLYKDENMKILTPSEVGGFLFTDLEGLVDVVFTNTAATTTNTTFDADFIFGTAQTPRSYVGADDTTDWEVYNATTLAAVTVDSVTEASAGTYDLAHAVGVSSSDVLEVTVTRDGFSGTFTVTAA